MSREQRNELVELLEREGLGDYAFAVKLDNLSRGQASRLSVECCQRGLGRLATLLGRYAHPLPTAAA